MKLSEETLMAYVDGELDGPAREQVARAVAADPEVARRVAAHQALRGTLRAAFDPVLKEPVPARFLSLVQGTSTGAKPAQVLPFRTRPVPQRSWVQWASLAASFVLGALAWQFALRMNTSDPLSAKQGEIVASGTLERALNGQLAANQAPTAAVQIGLSFISKQGPYCRTFSMRGTDAAGLACRGSAGWTVQVLMHETPSPSKGQYRQAASEMPPAVVAAVADAIVGEPLDASAEARAQAGGWQAKPH
ncbi:MAG TPA: hypothetical protein VGV09_17235 [Steroidobacteraceae bacterium]|nr:hypothetical protein [Steroidobacteraceae bacterium]